MTNTLPTSAFDGILAKLADVLEITQRAEGINNPQTRQALLQATKDFKDALLKAKDTANGLPGGELSIADQDRVIEMLEKLRERTR
ncbi:hypothetical protein PUNSTDRAFT_58941 [Punctularia strigosozonata HHB-11173 SS5]|uniref:uncharacterized protein n=1 Tax=Punctularia strigosozonata (strain HHB-11173) TaxID=741275 RepID=UPI00044177FC|nr:uncharacterized protein PUNSTDRAFT_58941 [Punctularia strigosozonata HHB-11173 SS5]EIN13353.1 hypothetical protein PUNSTDRAFT_58941 [Punctularia strigosozonata HHB-11173 SS5]